MNSLRDEDLFQGVGDALRHTIALVTELAERGECGSQFSSAFNNHQHVADVFSAVAPLRKPEKHSQQKGDKEEHSQIH